MMNLVSCLQCPVLAEFCRTNEANHISEPPAGGIEEPELHRDVRHRCGVKRSSKMRRQWFPRLRVPRLQGLPLDSRAALHSGAMWRSPHARAGTRLDVGSRTTNQQLAARTIRQGKPCSPAAAGAPAPSRGRSHPRIPQRRGRRTFLRRQQVDVARVQALRAN
jgi:hypothetical protein